MQRQNIHVAARIRPLLQLVSNTNEKKIVRAVSRNLVRIEGGQDFVFDLAVGEDKDQVSETQFCRFGHKDFLQRSIIRFMLVFPD